MAAHQDATQLFVEQLTCPVCYDLFTDRILQCSLGHSICENCYNKVTLCAQCRRTFSGTRNFLLEEMVKQLKQMRSKTAAVIPSVLNDDENVHKELAEQLSKQLAKLIETVPKIESNQSNDEQMQPIILIESIDHIPRQPRGFFNCRLLNCNQPFAICRILNHIRSMHLSELIEHRLENAQSGEYITTCEFECGDYRRAIRITQWGIFFFIVNVKRYRNKTLITSWIQMVGRKDEAKSFKFDLKMKIGNFIVSYQDYAYADSSDAIYIESKKQCLWYDTVSEIEAIGDIGAELKILKTTERITRRNSITDITPVPQD